ncbi:hypothetical protein GGF46_004684 [Coemansia sp. RSA 552]|nr:hypothetical protein GGF46_004684 [Coemansia sp. RSA 552]
MADQIVDEFYTARNLLYLGALPQALAALSQQQHLAGTLEQEKKTLYYRALLAQGNHQVLLDQLPATSTDPSLLALRQLALVCAGQEASVDSLVDDSNNLQSATFTCIAAQVLLRTERTEDALRILALHSKSLECVLLTISAYVQMSRVDLAQKLIARVRAWAEDAPVAQLAEALTWLFVGGPKYTEAFYIFEELAQASVPTAKLTTAQAVCKMHLAQYPEALSLLEEALAMDSGDADTLANLVVCATLAGKPDETRQLYLTQLRHAAPTHPFVVDLDTKADEFDKIAAKLA